MNPSRISKIESVVSARQPDLTVVLENIGDWHNISAIARTCESIGIFEIFVVYSDGSSQPESFKLGKRTSAGAKKWVEVHYFHDLKTCMEIVKNKYKTIWATHLGVEAHSVFNIDFCESCALLFGNESEGLSEEALSYADGNFIIPQVGFVESLNLSVACGITLFECFRQRNNAGMYSINSKMTPELKSSMIQDYIERSGRSNKTFIVNK
jgi:tRNA (guanosine-2'-O-)-methyltransferase